MRTSQPLPVSCARDLGQSLFVFCIHDDNETPSRADVSGPINVLKVTQTFRTEGIRRPE
jgi:hypothetical protein